MVADGVERDVRVAAVAAALLKTTVDKFTIFIQKESIKIHFELVSKINIPDN
jgi:hypothetical protein